MTTYAIRDSSTMLRRSLRRMRRYPSLTVMLIGQPVLFLLLFVYVFGGTLGSGLGGGRADYVGYVTPTILLLTITSAILGTAIAVASDMTEGIVARFRTMAISRASVLTGHVAGTIVQTAFALVVVLGVALLIGFSPAAGFGEWLALIGMLLLVTLSFTWFSVALGLKAKSVETASNTPMIFTLLPFLGSGFVPTDSMPGWLAWFAEYQPISPIIETIRGLLLGTPVGNSWLFAVGWCVVIGGIGFAWSKSLFGKERDR